MRIEPLYDMANADSSTAFTITIDPDNMPSGHFANGIAIHSSHAG